MNNPFNIALPTEKTPKGDFSAIKDSQHWVNTLPLGNSGESAKQLFHALKTVIGHNFSATEKLEFCECARTPIKQVSLSLEKHYLDQPIPLTDKAQLIADLTIQFHHGLAVAYIQSLAKLLTKSPTPSLFNKKILLTGLSRAITHLSHSLLRCYQAYVSTPKNAWWDINHLYQYAARYNLHKETLSDNSYHNRLLSIEELYKQALLMSQCDPYSLSCQEIILVNNKLEKWCHHTTLLPSKDSSHCDDTPIIAINLESDSPSYTLKPSNAAEMAKADYVFETSGLTAQLTHVIESDNGVENNAQTLQKEETKYLFQRINASWQSVAQREPRKKGQGHVIVVMGLSNAHTVLEVKGDSLAEYDTQAATCSILDVSSKGCRLQWPKEVTKVMIGMLVAFRKKSTEKNKATWNVGLVRWIKADRRGAAEVGIEILLPDAVAADITVISQEGQKSQPTHCLRASEHNKNNSLASLIVPAYIARLNNKLYLQYQKKEDLCLEENVRLTRIKEITKHFACCEYEDNTERMDTKTDATSKKSTLSGFMSDKDDTFWEHI